MHCTEQQELPGTRLLRIARDSIAHGLVHGVPSPIHLDELPAALATPAASFTTLRLDGELRGCCGTLEAANPLAASVARSAFSAAFRDRRFAPVRDDELDAILLELSVLSPMEPMTVTDEADLLAQLTPGTDGLVIDAGGRRATFLPEVWHTLPEPRRFVAALKNKCGLAQDYWSDALAFRRYRATSYSEAAEPVVTR